MENDRPVVSITPNAFDLVCLGLVSVTILITGVLLGIGYPDLPEMIPTHYGFEGIPDSQGAKSTLIVLFIAEVGVSGLLVILSRYPHIHNSW